MEVIDEPKINKMYHAVRGIHYLKQKGIDSSHLLPSTIHINQDGSGVQMILGGDGRGVLNKQPNMRKLRTSLTPMNYQGRGLVGKRNRMKGGGVKEMLLPSIIGISPLLVKSILKMGTHGFKEGKKDLMKISEKFGDLVVDDAIRRSVGTALKGKKEQRTIETQTDESGIRESRTI